MIKHISISAQQLVNDCVRKLCAMCANWDKECPNCKYSNHQSSISHYQAHPDLCEYFSQEDLLDN